MSIADQNLSTRHTALQAVHAFEGGAPGPEAISPWEMVLLAEDKIPPDAIVLVPDKWVMQ
jgi:hypothetical protein